MMRHIMVDIETLGSKPGSVILSIGACRFNENGIAPESFYRPIDVFDSLMQGLTTDPATVGWWRMQSPEARGVLRPTVLLTNALADFAAYVTGGSCLWAKGPDFDLILLEAAYGAIGQKKPWHYRAARDVRTMLALAPLPVGLARGGPEHHALADAEYQARQVIAAAAHIGITLSEMR